MKSSAFLVWWEEWQPGERWSACGRRGKTRQAGFCLEPEQWRQGAVWWERDGDGITAREGREKIEEGFCFGSGGRKRKAQVPEDSPTCYREREREREREQERTSGAEP